MQSYRSTVVLSAVAPLSTSRHLPSVCRVLFDSTVHCCALLLLQVKTWTGLKSVVEALRSSRHRPWYPVAGPWAGVVLPMADVVVLEVPALVVTEMEAVLPGVTAHWPLLPEGCGTVKVTAESLQLSMLKAAESPGAPQLVPLSLKVR